MITENVTLWIQSKTFKLKKLLTPIRVDGRKPFQNGDGLMANYWSQSKPVHRERVDGRISYETLGEHANYFL